MTNSGATTHDAYHSLNEASINRKHWLTVFTAGMGFFTDAYDLFIIGTVTVILTPIFNLSTNQISLLNSISLLASVVGAMVFGKLMDRLGRKRMYGVEVTILVVGALLSALSWNFTSLMIFRVLVGLGVGGDYATSAVITAEYANRRSRGRLIGTVFAMQGFGLLAGPLIASIFLATGVANGVAWRLMLALGAIPAASVIYLRRKIRETPRFTMAVQGDAAMTNQTVAWTLGDGVTTSAPAPVATTPARVPLRARLTSKPFLKRLIGTAGAWFLLDVAYYGNSVSSPLILKTLQPNGTLLNHTLISLAIFTVCALPGYWVAVALLDKLGRRRIQIQGFLMMTAAYFVIALVPGVTDKVWVFLTLFGFSYFFVEFGPNMTTFVYPSEIFPTSIRGAGDGISAAAGKFGAFLGALFVPHLLNSVGIRGVMAVMGTVSIVGALLTRLALPEPNGLTLEESSGEVYENVDGAPGAPRSEAELTH